MLSELPSSPVAKLVEAARTTPQDFAAAVRVFLAGEECNPETVAAIYNTLDEMSQDPGILAHAYKIFAEQVRALKPALIPSLPLDVPWEVSAFYARERAKQALAKDGVPNATDAAAGLQLIVAHLQTPHAALGAPTLHP